MAASLGTDRRAFLQGATSLPLLLAARSAAQDSSPTGRPGGPFPGMIIRQFEPANLEMPFPTLDGFLVPTARFFIRSHFATPRIDPATWRLCVEGAVERPLELTLDELRRMPARTAPVLLECSGNS